MVLNFNDTSVYKHHISFFNEIKAIMNWNGDEINYSDIHLNVSLILRGFVEAYNYERYVLLTKLLDTEVNELYIALTTELGSPLGNRDYNIYLFNSVLKKLTFYLLNFNSKLFKEVVDNYVRDMEEEDKTEFLEILKGEVNWFSHEINNTEDGELNRFEPIFLFKLIYNMSYELMLILWKAYPYIIADMEDNYYKMVECDIIRLSEKNGS